MSSTIVCCCDFGDCEVLLLHRRNAVLSTLCGLCVFEDVVHAAISLQVSWRAVRWHRARRRIRLKRRQLCLKWLEIATAVGAKTRERAATRIQRMYRGQVVRRLPEVHLLKKYIALTRTRLPVFNELWPGIGIAHDASSEAADTECSSIADDMDVDDVVIEYNNPRMIPLSPSPPPSYRPGPSLNHRACNGRRHPVLSHARAPNSR